MPKKLTIEHVRKYTENSKDTILLSKVYENAHEKLEFQCVSKGHQYKMSFSSFKRDHRCPECAGNKKLTIEDVKMRAKKMAPGFKLKSTVYENNQEKLEWRCPKNHTFWASYGNFINKGSRCPICAIKIRSEKCKLTIEDVKKYTENSKDTILNSKVYVNSKEKLDFQCISKGHQYKMSFNSFQQGQRCSICSGKQKHSYEDVKKYYADRKYTYLPTTYTNTQTKESVRCPKNHKFNVKFDHFKNSGSRCPICAANATSSKGEKEVGQFVKSLLQHDIDIVLNDRTQILNPSTDCFLELDVYIPSLKKAIEYNGTYYHGFIGVKQRDKIKVEECKRLGIDLLIVNEENWRKNREAEKKVIEQWLK